MRLVSGVLALTLFASLAHADGPAAAPSQPAAAPSQPVASQPSAPARTHVPLRVVRVMPESHQALLFDRDRSTHVLAEVGGKIDGYLVEDIDDDQVTLSYEGKEIVLAAPMRGPRESHRRDQEAPARVVSAGRPADGADGGPTPLDPYGEAPAGAATASAGPVREIEPGQGGVRVAQAPTGPAMPSREVEPGDGGVRVVSAGGSSGATATTVAATAGAPTMTASVTSASPSAPGTIASPVAPSTSAPGTAASPVAPSTSAPGITASPVAPSTNVPGQAAAAPAIRVVSASGSAAAPAVRVASARSLPQPRTAAEKQAYDARAMADVFASDEPVRSTRRLPGGDVVVATAPTAAAALPAGTIVLSRAEVDSALGDFAALTAAVHASFTSSGVRVEGVGDLSIFQRAGLHPGDVIVSVDGVALRSLDDAANLYARASSAKAFTAQVVRDGKPVTLRVAIQ